MGGWPSRRTRQALAGTRDGRKRGALRQEFGDWTRECAGEGRGRTSRRGSARVLYERCRRFAQWGKDGGAGACGRRVESQVDYRRCPRGQPELRNHPRDDGRLCEGSGFVALQPHRTRRARCDVPARREGGRLSPDRHLSEVAGGPCKGDCRVSEVGSGRSPSEYARKQNRDAAERPAHAWRRRRGIVPRHSRDKGRRCSRRRRNVRRGIGSRCREERGCERVSRRAEAQPRRGSRLAAQAFARSVGRAGCGPARRSAGHAVIEGSVRLFDRRRNKQPETGSEFHGAQRRQARQRGLAERAVLRRLCRVDDYGVRNGARAVRRALLLLPPDGTGGLQRRVDSTGDVCRRPELHAGLGNDDILHGPGWARVRRRVPNARACACGAYGCPPPAPYRHARQRRVTHARRRDRALERGRQHRIRSKRPARL